MKCYTYKDEELPVKLSHPYRPRLELPQTDDPQEAGVFMVPCCLFEIGTALVKELPYWPGNERRHFIVDISDCQDVTHSEALILRTAATRTMLKDDPNTLALPWPVEDFGDVADCEIDYDVGYVGWATGRPETLQALESCRRAGLKCLFTVRPRFYGHVDEATQKQWAKEYREALGRSRLWLCPQSGYGYTRYRYYESISAARLPIFIGKRPLLPYEDQIDWGGDLYAIFIDTKYACETGQRCQDFLNRNSHWGAAYWCKDLWNTKLDHKLWPKLWCQLAKERIGPSKAANFSRAVRRIRSIAGIPRWSEASARSSSHRR